MYKILGHLPYLYIMSFFFCFFFFVVVVFYVKSQFFYFQVKDVRTNDDTMITVKLMLFYEMKDVLKMVC